jgi:hypothetical protein
MTEPQAAAPPEDATPIGLDVARTAIALLPPVTLIVGLLFYFGWVRTAAVAHALEQDPSIFGYSTTDYVLRSVNALFWPLLVLTTCALLALLAHQQVQRVLRERGPAGWALPAAWILLGLGFALLGYSVLYTLRLAELQNSVVDVTGPVALGVGALLLAYGGWLRSQARRGPGVRLPVWQRAFAAGMLMAIAALSLFWAVGQYATVRGKQDAELIVASYAYLPAVVVYSEKDIGLEPNASVVAQTGTDAKYAYRYGCLRLLDHVAGVWYLIPDDWFYSRRLIMLREDSDLRFELESAEVEKPCPGLD